MITHFLELLLSLHEQEGCLVKSQVLPRLDPFRLEFHSHLDFVIEIFNLLMVWMRKRLQVLLQSMITELVLLVFFLISLLVLYCLHQL